MSMYSLTASDLSNHINAALHNYLLQMMREEVITEEQFERMVRNFKMVAHEPGLFGTLVSSVLGHEKGLRYTVVKVLADEMRETDDHRSENSD
jgi:hypothetical protein